MDLDWDQDVHLVNVRGCNWPIITNILLATALLFTLEQLQPLRWGLPSPLCCLDPISSISCAQMTKDQRTYCKRLHQHINDSIYYDLKIYSSTYDYDGSRFSSVSNEIKKTRQRMSDISKDFERFEYLISNKTKFDVFYRKCFKLFDFEIQNEFG
jgi:hypothetical protein